MNTLPDEIIDTIYKYKHEMEFCEVIDEVDLRIRLNKGIRFLHRQRWMAKYRKRHGFWNTLSDEIQDRIYKYKHQ